MNSIVNIKKPSSKDIETSLNQILSDLEQYGTSTIKNGKASRYLSRYVKQQKNQQQIFFSWNKQWQMSVIHIPPSVKIERIGTRKIKFLFQDII